MTIRNTNRTTVPVARGQRRKGNNRGANVVFDPESFMQIRNSAIQQGISFAERVRDLCEIGMETEKISKDLS